MKKRLIKAVMVYLYGEPIKGIPADTPCTVHTVEPPGYKDSPKSFNHWGVYLHAQVKHRSNGNSRNARSK